MDYRKAHYSICLYLKVDLQLTILHNNRLGYLIRCYYDYSMDPYLDKYVSYLGY